MQYCNNSNNSAEQLIRLHHKTVQHTHKKKWKNSDQQQKQQQHNIHHDNHHATSAQYQFVFFVNEDWNSHVGGEWWVMHICHVLIVQQLWGWEGHNINQNAPPGMNGGSLLTENKNTRIWLTELTWSDRTPFLGFHDKVLQSVVYFDLYHCIL